MTTKISRQASMPNPALKPFEILLGDWETTGSHPSFPGVTLHGRASFEWLESGAFLVARSEIDNTEFPSGIEIFGSDDAAGTYYMLHFDARGVSRKYNVNVADGQISWWRDDPGFSQRFTLMVENNGRMLVSSGEMSHEGPPWEKDLTLTYTRSKK